jgi:hypothetical protein
VIGPELEITPVWAARSWSRPAVDLGEDLAGAAASGLGLSSRCERAEISAPFGDAGGGATAAGVDVLRLPNKVQLLSSSALQKALDQ